MAPSPRRKPEPPAPPPEQPPALLLKTVALDTLIDNPRNPRRHSDDQIIRLMASLRDRGQLMPVLARTANNMLIVGHGVCQAARRLGWTDIRALLWNVDQRRADAYMLADNRLSDLSSHDDARVAELLREISDDDLLGAGFNEAEVAKLFGSFDDVLEIKEIQTDAVRDDFWISVSGPLRLQAVALDRIRQLMAELPEVTVDLGTIQRGEGFM